MPRVGGPVGDTVVSARVERSVDVPLEVSAVNQRSNSQIRRRRKVVVRAVEKDQVVSVYIAEDADSRMILPLQQVCLARKIPVVGGSTMEELGIACGIDVGAAAIAATGAVAAGASRTLTLMA